MKDTAQHTKKWQWSTRGKSRDFVVLNTNTGEVVCEIFGDGTWENERGEKNAWLASSAPALLEALEDAIERLEKYGEGTSSPDVMASYRATIDLAKKGEVIQND